MIDTPVNQTRGRVIIIDDDAEVLSAFSTLLKMEGYFCDCYPSAVAYITALTEQHLCFTGPSCMLCDVRMPELDGLALQTQLSEQSDTPLILMSGDSGAQEVAQAFRAGAVDFLIKPIDINMLLNTVEKSLALSMEQRAQHIKTTTIATRVRSLTMRERDIAMLVVQGKTNQAIATELNIALRTVKLHRHRAMEKLDVQHVADLVRIFVGLDA